ncbi:DNA replication/repair protein RecF [Dictyobacter arantiisoli]|uniref:DNA replication and repair protein RecF n=1 Tax=Dictyobacter arantiisoli TaxID=2014874 RepID=A0A5A5TDB5_9CHLR|nr:DNA replication/repair protein RecF [Dictyobacter arantiisoli]GCF09268.1 DNA replication and repair protein RecF [Dictyobacter arantiisoli]
MYLSRLTLADFRNYEQLEVSLGPGLFLFHGENAQGKTNLLEAVSMLATGTSFHASSDREVVSWSAPAHVAHLDGMLQRQEGQAQLEITLLDPSPALIPATVGSSSSARSIELPAHAPRKRYKVNGAPKRTVDFIGQMKVVMFAPTDLHLVDGAPEERRKFLDRALCQVRPLYSVALIKYRKLVTQRSALLKRVRENQEDPQMLNYLDEQLVQLANQIIYERVRMVKALNEQANQFQQAISGGREELRIIYHPSFQVDVDWNPLEAPGHYMEQLHAVRKKEIYQGVCLRGPHRDDLEFRVNGVNMLSYGSRGQQRTAALAAKLSELAFMHNTTGDQPILLLDDVFSELDAQRREYLLCQIASYQQVLLTATELEGFPDELARRFRRYRVSNGTLTVSEEY